jgi:hypothetical protein
MSFCSSPTPPTPASITMMQVQYPSIRHKFLVLHHLPLKHLQLHLINCQLLYLKTLAYQTSNYQIKPFTPYCCPTTHHSQHARTARPQPSCFGLHTTLSRPYKHSHTHYTYIQHKQRQPGSISYI